jgi:cytochrome c553
MNSRILLPWLTLTTIAIIALWMRPAPAPLAAEEPELALMMARQQVWAHKLALSIEAEDRELIDFYHHELEESTHEVIDQVSEYDGFPISEMVKTMFLPELEAMKGMIAEAPISDIRAQFSVVIKACNSCHGASAHGFIRISDQAGPNPYLQDF